MTTLRVIKALYGDGFLFQTSKEDKSFTMVIDGGPSGAWIDFRDAMQELRKIDMIVLTHYDTDHIAALAKYLAHNRETAMVVKKYWLNLSQFINVPNPSPNVGYDEAMSLKKFMEDLETDAPEEIKWKEPVIVKSEYSDDNKLVKLTAISPTEANLKKNLEVLSKKETERKENVGKVSLLSATESSEEKKDSSDQSLESLLDKKYKDNRLINKASIAFICEVHDRKKFLFSGDASSETMCEALKDMGFTPDNPLKVDLFKIPHHGSKANMSLDLLSLVRTNNYLITTNGDIYRHPDRETLAMIILNPLRDKEETVNIYLNYSLSDLRRKNPNLISDEEINNKDYNFRIIDNQTDISF